MGSYELIITRIDGMGVRSINLEGLKMRISIVLFVFLFSNFSSAIKAENIFDPATNVLTLDSVTVPGDQIYYNVAVRLDQFTVLSVGSSAPIVTGVSGVCGRENFTVDKYNAIRIGMTLNQVTQIIGCEHDPSYTMRLGIIAVGGSTTADLVRYAWIDLTLWKEITVFFDDASGRVTDPLGVSFKHGSL